MRLTFSSNNNTQRGFQNTSPPPPPPRRAQEPEKKRQKSIHFPENNRPNNQKILRNSTKIATKTPFSLDKNTQQTHLMSPTSTPPPRPALNFTPSPKEKAGNKVGEGKQNKEVFAKPKKHRISQKHIGSKYKPATRREGKKRRKRQRQRDTVPEERNKRRDRDGRKNRSGT
jgi:hypothetical protein